MRENGVLTDLGAQSGWLGDTVPDDGSSAVINERGQVLMVGGMGDGVALTAVWENGTLTNLGIHDPSSHLVAINDPGQILLRSSDENGLQHAFLWDKGVLSGAWHPRRNGL